MFESGVQNQWLSYTNTIVPVDLFPFGHSESKRSSVVLIECLDEKVIKDFAFLCNLLTICLSFIPQSMDLLGKYCIFMPVTHIILLTF